LGRRRWLRKPSLRVLGEGRPPPVSSADQQEIDRILEKIASDGMSSLSRQERARLEAASNRLRR
jgi:hypothetical protein